MSLRAIRWVARLAMTLCPLPAAGGLASGQDSPRDARLDRLPVSVSLPVLVGWAEGSRGLGLTTGVSLSVRTSATAAAGITIRSWLGDVGAQPCSLGGDCFWQQETTGLAFLAHADLYPFRKRLLFFRAAGGISWLREREAQGTVIHEARSWPFTLLAAVGWDARLTNHVYATPLLELLATARHEPAPRSSPPWFVQTGVALTVR
ncbi:MAG: hypothetical protein DMD44_13750 [Gemmatimonadetes bacterium]|nr:MAG: hypothetical protein DMD44_13750 [Gemmatimonadota bacterium]